MPMMMATISWADSSPIVPADSAPTTSAPTSTSTIAPVNEVGWEFSGESTLNATQFHETEYVGDCPGVDTETKEARFTSSQTPPGDRRRVVVRNVTRGMDSDPFPYTDREYDKGRSSEATKMEFGAKHSSKRFRVQPGVNEFEYDIREGDRVITSGKFTANFEKVSRQVERNAQWYDEEVCANSSVSNSVCADLRQRHQLRCPNGSVLKSYFESDDSSAYRTLISNQSRKDVVFSIEGDLYRLDPGESVRLRRRSSFRVRYNPTCSTCEPTNSTSVDAGKRVKFHNSGGRIELVDYPRNDW